MNDEVGKFWFNLERINEVGKLQLKIQIDIRKVMRGLTLYGWNETFTMHVEITSKVDGLESKRTVYGGQTERPKKLKING